VLALFLQWQSFAANNPLISLCLQFHALFSQNLVTISLSTTSAILQQSGTCEHIPKPKIDENHEAYLHDETFRIAETDWSRNNASESVSQPILDCNSPGATYCLGACVPHGECSHNYRTFNNVINIS
jgi:hypothetical protein